MILLDGFGGIHTFWTRTHRTISWAAQTRSRSGGSIPDLRPVQLALIAVVAVAALAAGALAPGARFPDRRGALGCAMIGLQLTLTYWFYLYIPWFLPFVLVATVPELAATAAARAGSRTDTDDGVPIPEATAG